jgi:hypothetical protein
MMRYRVEFSASYEVEAAEHEAVEQAHMLLAEDLLSGWEFSAAIEEVS